MARRAPRRWGTPFGRWVGNYGVSRLARTISERARDGRALHPVTHWSVYGWLSGEHTPRSYYLTQIVELSQGAVQQHDIIRHQEIVAGRKR
jgi:hypothetical protein